MHARFFAPDLTPDRPVVALPAAEAEHLVRVLRLAVGEPVLVFDGRGHEYYGRVQSISRREVIVLVTGPAPTAPEPSVCLTLAQAVLKRDRMDEVVRDAAMLGASAVQPVVSARTETQMAQLVRAGAVERWSRITIASVKQCGRAVVPIVHQARALPDYVRDETADLRIILVEPSSARFSGRLDFVTSRPRPATASVLVGPEGGWMEAEIDLAARSGFVPVTLGPRTLRADATPVAALAVLQFLWGDL